MVPSTGFAVVSFLVVLAPGIVFELLRQGHRPSRDQSALEELGRVILWGLAFSSVGFLLLWVVRTAKSDWIPDIAEWLKDSDGYVQDHYRLIFRTLVLQAVLAISAAALVNRLASTRNHIRRCVLGAREWIGGGGSIRPHPVWWTVLRQYADQEQAKVRLSVRLQDGSTLTGGLAEYTTRGEPRDLTLEQPIYVSRPGQQPNLPLDPDVGRVLVPGPSISEIAIIYEPPGD